jgi:hypothetical protein
MIKKISIALLIVLVVIQFIRPAHNSSAAVPSKQVSAVVSVPDSVKQILEVACYDCHSNNTRYPWYSNIQPVGWWLANHVKDGKRAVNFDEFASYDLDEQKHKMKDVNKSIDKGFMPLKSYLIIHKDAVLTDAQKKQLLNWSRAASEELSKK